MSHSWEMLGLDTLETIWLGSGYGEAFDAVPLEQRDGPRVNYRYLGGNEYKFL